MEAQSETASGAPPVAAADLLSLHALAQPDKLAVAEDRPGAAPVRWTFAHLEERANRLAAVLAQLGAAPGDKVAWCGPNSPAVVAFTHAARKAGLTAVPLNYRLSASEAAYVVDNSDAVLVYADAEMADLFAAIRADIPKVSNVVLFGPAGTAQAGPAGTAQAGRGMLDGYALLEEVGPVGPPSRPGAASAAGTMIYTSGTTGRPKGAVRQGSGDPAQVKGLLDHIGYRGDDVYLTTGPLYHSGPGGFMALAHALGNTVVVQRRFDPEDWLALVDRHRVTSTFSAPTPIRLVCNLAPEVKARYDRSSMRIMVANAAPWSFALKQAYLADFPADSLWEVYGSTEMGVDTALAPADQLRKPGSCGLPVPGVEVKLFAEDGSEVDQPGVPGELYVRSKSMFSTYHKAEDKYEADRRGDFHTVGDIAYRDEEGYLYICDRKTDMVITGGMNVYPAEVEAALEAHPDVTDVAVFGIPSEEWGETVHAVVVPRAGSDLSAEGVVAHARDRLASYKVPRSVSFAEELPRTGSGKLLKRVLRQPWWEGQGRQVS